MKVGQYKNQQYIIPLSCDYEVLTSEENNIEHLKQKNLVEWLEEAKISDNISLKKVMLGRRLAAGKWLKEGADYEKKGILFDTERWGKFYLDNMLFLREQFEQVGEGHIGSFLDVNENTKAIAVIPDIEGKRLASVQAFGAIGMSSDYKEEAYQFLMLFLNDEVRIE